jgi:hypothetical protein
MHHLHQIPLCLHHRVNRLVRHRSLVDHVRILPALDPRRSSPLRRARLQPAPPLTQSSRGKRSGNNRCDVGPCPEVPNPSREAAPIACLRHWICAVSETGALVYRELTTVQRPV